MAPSPTFMLSISQFSYFQKTISTWELITEMPPTQPLKQFSIWFKDEVELGHERSKNPSFWISTELKKCWDFLIEFSFINIRYDELKPINPLKATKEHWFMKFEFWNEWQKVFYRLMISGQFNLSWSFKHIGWDPIKLLETSFNHNLSSLWQFTMKLLKFWDNEHDDVILGQADI